jgi:plasmid stability protein
MAVLSIRKLPDEVHARLRVRAAKAGRSMEAEARAILEAAMASEAGDKHPLREFREQIDRLYGPNKPKHAVEELIAERRCEAERE